MIGRNLILNIRINSMMAASNLMRRLMCAVFCAAARSTMMIRSCAALIATGSIRSVGATSSVFVCRRRAHYSDLCCSELCARSNAFRHKSFDNKGHLWICIFAPSTPEGVTTSGACRNAFRHKTPVNSQCFGFVAFFIILKFYA